MKQVFVFLAIALFCINAAAISVDVASTVYIYDQAKDVSIRITNDSGSSQDYSIEFSAPTNFSLSQNNGIIDAGRNKTVRLTIEPNSELVSQTYKSKLEVRIGEEKYVKMVNLVFREAVDEGETGQESPIGFFTFAPLGTVAGEIALNITLVLIAAILLIAFIARFIKRMEGH